MSTLNDILVATPDNPRPQPASIYGQSGGYALPPGLRPEVDPSQAITGMPPNYGREPVPHVATYQGIMSTLSRVYRPSDEAIKHSRENARFMRNDPAVMECIEQRQRSTALLDWHIQPDDPGDEKQKWLAKQITAILRETPRFMQYRENLLHALWYGRYGIMHKYQWKLIGGKWRLHIGEWIPVNGDKVVFRFDDGSGNYDPNQIGLRVGAGITSDGALKRLIPKDRHAQLMPTDWGLAYFLDPWQRRLMAVHKHMIEDAEYENPIDAGRIHGVGIRSRIYWLWYQRQECLAWLMEFIERSAFGIEMWYYPQGNAEAKKAVEDAAVQRVGMGRNIIFVPRPLGEQGMAYGVERIEPSMGGADALREILTDLFGHQIKRYILGQTLTSEAGSTGLGSNLASIHLDTFLQIIRYDATNLEESITRETIAPLVFYNFPSMVNVPIRFKIETEAQDVEGKLQGWRQAYEMGCKLRPSDVMDLVGAKDPLDNGDYLQSPAYRQGHLQVEQAEQMAEQGADMQGMQGAQMPRGQQVPGMPNDPNKNIDIAPGDPGSDKPGDLQKFACDERGTVERYDDPDRDTNETSSKGSGEHEDGWTQVGGTAVQVDENGRINPEHACAGLAGQYIDDITNESSERRHDRAENQKESLAATEAGKPLTGDEKVQLHVDKGTSNPGGGPTEPDSRKESEKEPSEDPTTEPDEDKPEEGKRDNQDPEGSHKDADKDDDDTAFDPTTWEDGDIPKPTIPRKIKTAAKEWGVDPGALFSAAEDSYETMIAVYDTREEGKETLLNSMNLTPKKVQSMTNQGMDHDSIRHYDDIVDEFHNNNPGVLNDDDPLDSAWQLMGRNKQRRPGVTSDSVLEEAMQRLQEQESGPEITDVDTDDDFGASEAQAEREVTISTMNEAVAEHMGNSKGKPVPPDLSTSEGVTNAMDDAAQEAQWDAEDKAYADQQAERDRREQVATGDLPLDKGTQEMTPEMQQTVGEMDKSISAMESIKKEAPDPDAEIQALAASGMPTVDSPMQVSGYDIAVVKGVTQFNKPGEGWTPLGEQSILAARKELGIPELPDKHGNAPEVQSQPEAEINPQSQATTSQMNEAVTAATQAATEPVAESSGKQPVNSKGYPSEIDYAEIQSMDTPDLQSAFSEMLVDQTVTRLGSMIDIVGEIYDRQPNRTKDRMAAMTDLYDRLERQPSGKNGKQMRDKLTMLLKGTLVTRSKVDGIRRMGHEQPATTPEVAQSEATTSQMNEAVSSSVQQQDTTDDPRIPVSTDTDMSNATLPTRTVDRVGAINAGIRDELTQATNPVEALEALRNVDTTVFDPIVNNTQVANAIGLRHNEVVRTIYNESVRAQKIIDQYNEGRIDSEWALEELRDEFGPLNAMQQRIARAQSHGEKLASITPEMSQRIHSTMPGDQHQAYQEAAAFYSEDIPSIIESTIQWAEDAVSGESQKPAPTE